MKEDSPLNLLIADIATWTSFTCCCRAGLTYIIEHVGHPLGLLKIGSVGEATAYHLAQRIKKQRDGQPHHFKLIGLFNGKEAEKWLFKRYAEHKFINAPTKDFFFSYPVISDLHNYIDLALISKRCLSCILNVPSLNIKVPIRQTDNKIVAMAQENHDLYVNLLCQSVEIPKWLADWRRSVLDNYAPYDAYKVEFSYIFKQNKQAAKSILAAEELISYINKHGIPVGDFLKERRQLTTFRAHYKNYLTGKTKNFFALNLFEKTELAWLLTEDFSSSWEWEEDGIRQLEDYVKLHGNLPIGRQSTEESRLNCLLSRLRTAEKRGRVILPDWLSKEAHFSDKARLLSEYIQINGVPPSASGASGKEYYLGNWWKNVRSNKVKVLQKFKTLIDQFGLSEWFTMPAYEYRSKILIHKWKIRKLILNKEREGLTTGAHRE